MQGDGCSRKRKWQCGERHLSQVRGGRAGFQVGETSRLGSVSWVRDTKKVGKKEGLFGVKGTT